MKKSVLFLFCAIAVAANALTVEEARANLRAARVAYTNALAEAGITNTPRTARTRKVRNTPTRNVLSEKQRSFFENRRIAVNRDTSTLPGYVITTWHRNGKPDTLGPAVVTNALQHIVGAEQFNPLQKLAERFRQQAEQWQTLATNATARVERVSAALDERREEYVQKRDAAALPTTKAIYQAFIDAIDRIKAKLDQEGD